MKAAIVTAILIVVGGVGAGVVANTAVYKLKWVREAQPVEKDDPAAKDPAKVEPAKTVVDACQPKPEDKPNTIRMECVLHYLEVGGAYIIDAREENDFIAGHLRPAIHLPSSGIYANINRVMESGAQATDTIIVYCGGGDCEASHNVADALRNDFQYKNVLIYDKGWQEIETSGKFGAYLITGVEN